VVDSFSLVASIDRRSSEYLKLVAIPLHSNTVTTKSRQSANTMSTAQSMFVSASAGILKNPSNLPEDKSISRIHQFLIIFPTCTALLSLLIYTVQQLRRLRQHKRGAIRLPINAKASSDRTGVIRLEDDEDDVQEEKVTDVWDIRDPEMEIDGYPIEEEAFWRKVCLTGFAGIQETVLRLEPLLDAIQENRTCRVAAHTGRRHPVLAGLLPFAA
jgi:hypothetical protein